MPVMRVLIAVIAAVLIATPVVAAGGGNPAPAGASKKAKAKAGLARFTSCGGLIRYARRHASRRYVNSFTGAGPRTGGPMPVAEGAPGGTAPPANQPAAGGKGTTQDTSGTNVQEAGVDEPDIVKTDGRWIFALAQGKLHAVDARSDKPKLAGSLVRLGAAAERRAPDRRLLERRLLWRRWRRRAGRHGCAGELRQRDRTRLLQADHGLYRGRHLQPGDDEGPAHSDRRRLVRLRASDG
jgi:hypothetical protein